MSTIATTNLKNPSAGSNNIVLDSAGRVGMGSSSPINRLTIRASSDDGIALTRPSNQSIAHLLISTTEGGGDAYSVKYDTSNNNQIFSTFLAGGTGGNFIFRTGTSAAADAFQIANDGSMSAVVPGGSTLYPASFCRAWVNFNGTGAVAIRASYNVSSITDNGVSDYTVNFTNALADANYSAVGIAGSTAGTSAQMLVPGGAQTTTTCRLQSYVYNASTSDPSYVSVAIFR
jgi:hypothetical protein